MTQFYSSTRWAMKAEVDGFDGGVIFAGGIPRHSLERRKISKYPHLAQRVLDPQLYLARLSFAAASDACTKLSSYSWFDAKLPPFDSQKMKQAEWAAAVKAQVEHAWTGTIPTDSATISDRVRLCIEVQQRLGCEAILLPAPLATEPSLGFETELQWLDVGLELSSRIAPGVPRLASIAISDVCVRGTNPWSSAFLDTVIDQVTAREPEGAYVAIEQASHDASYETSADTLGALLRIVRDCRAAGLPRIVVPFAGTAGMLAVAAGATTWSTGWYKGQRRLRFADFNDSDEIRLAVPAYYSHQLAGEIHLKTDLDSIVAAKLFERVADHTQASEGLLRALRNGGVVASVPEWVSRKANTTAAREHFMRVMIRETAVLRDSPNPLDAAKRWLDEAGRIAQAISATGDFNQRTSLGHQRAWRAVLDQLG